jgi:hypothetical protein
MGVPIRRLRYGWHAIRSSKGARDGGHGRNRTGDKGFADLCLTTWLRGHKDAFNLADLSAFFKSLEAVLL